MAVVVVPIHHECQSELGKTEEPDESSVGIECMQPATQTKKNGVVGPLGVEIDASLDIKSVQLINEAEVQESTDPFLAQPQIRMTFEEHFQKPEVQRIYQFRLFRFEMLLRLAVLIVSLLCSTIHFQTFYRANKETNKTIIIVCTAIFSLASAGLPYFLSKVKRRRRHPRRTTKIQIITFVIQKLIYAALVSSWMDLLFLQAWTSPMAAPAETMPFLYTVPLCCTISLITHLVSPMCLLFGKIRLTRCQNYAISHFILGAFLIILVDIICNSSFEPKLWNWAQVGLATFLLEVEYVADFFVIDEVKAHKKSITPISSGSGYDHVSSAGPLSQNV